MTDTAFEQKVRERAYEMWMASGCENGLADRHWLSAEQAVMSEAAQPCAKAVAPAGKGGKSRAAKAAPKVTVRKRARKAEAHA